MNWEEFRMNEWRLVDATGRVVGRVERTYDGEFLAALQGGATAPGRAPLGLYATERQAKDAVQAAAEKQP